MAEARALEREVDRRLEVSRRERPRHERQADRVIDQLRRNHFGELMRASMEAR